MGSFFSAIGNYISTLTDYIFKEVPDFFFTDIPKVLWAFPHFITDIFNTFVNFFKGLASSFTGLIQKIFAFIGQFFALIGGFIKVIFSFLKIF
jgi:hypothetical protein